MVDGRSTDCRFAIGSDDSIANPAAFVNQRSVDHPSTFRLGWLGPLGGFLFRRGRYQQYSSYCRLAIADWRSTDCRWLMVDRRIVDLRLGVTIRSPTPLHSSISDPSITHQHSVSAGWVPLAASCSAGGGISSTP